ncbi:WSC domain-containing protein [Bipolaris maydis]|nr:WSC domain-containing protein [Bipolaris maydis]
MRASWIYLTSALCTGAVAYDPQYTMSTSDFSGISGNSYQCENGVKPSVTCTDPSLNNDTCSCTCTNGIIFNQPVPSPGQSSGGNDASLDICQAERNQYMEREREAMVKLHEMEQAHLKCQEGQAAELVAAQQAHAVREKELSDELTSVRQAHATCDRELSELKAGWSFAPFKHQGCYFDSTNRLINDKVTNDASMTVRRCRDFCQGYLHFGLEAGQFCFCGNKFLRIGKLAPEIDCSWPCAGNKNVNCGGSSRISLYSYQSAI